ncbi:MAG: glycosyltransferase [Candidatus Nomurabacteria bacterium]|jgi:glycosyltransferase involved in cell wall biosynthesis|nr:glycosyltransferase [Candidatus Nomurabacteria bacterium]
MRIVIASDVYWPAMNGCSVASKSVADGMSFLKHEVIVLAPSQTKKSGVEKDGAVKIYRLKSNNFPFYHNQITPPPIPNKIYKDGFKICVTPYKEIADILDEFKPDVIHVKTPLMIGQAANKYAVKNHIPCVATNHFLPENLIDNLRAFALVSKPISETIKLYEKDFLKKFDYVTMPTQMAIDLFWKVKERKIGLPPIEPVSNGIDLGKFKVGKVPGGFYKKYHIPKDKPIVTHLGRLDNEKHVGVLVEAFAKIAKRTGAFLVLVGCGNDEDNLKELVRELGISDKVIFTGKIIDKDKEIIHRVGTVFCMPSPVELQSLSMLEAMACGQPVVAVNAGALGELCQNGVNGYLCEKDDVAGIAKALREILLDKNLRNKFSLGSLAIAKKHDVQLSWKHYEAIYQKVIDLKKGMTGGI